MAHTVKAPLRRSFSEHVKNSTNRAWDVFWKSAREKRLSEIEAKEACDWLRAAGFPQYVQLFKDCRFPIDTVWVKSDHEFLDEDAIDSLCRRLATLNKCVEMKLEVKRSRRRSEDSEEEEPCAISNKWSFERQNEHWYRQEGLDFLPAPRRTSKEARNEDHSEKQEACSVDSSCSSDSDSHGPGLPANKLGVSRSTSHDSSHGSSPHKLTSLESSFSGPPSPSETSSFIGEECFRDKPPRNRGKSLLRRMEKLKIGGNTLRTKSRHRPRLTIGGPVPLEGFNEEKLRQLRCVDIATLQDKPESQLSSTATSSSGSSSSSPSESNSTISTPSPVTRIRGHRRRDGPPKHDCTCDQGITREQEQRNEKNQQGDPVFRISQEHKPGTFPMPINHGADNTSVNWRTGSFHGYRGRPCHSNSSGEQPCSPLAAPDHRASVYDNVPGESEHTHGTEEEDDEEEETEDDDVFSALDNVMERINGLQQLVSTWAEKLSDEGDLDSANDSASPCPSSPTDIHLEIKKHGPVDPIESEENAENFDKETDDLESAYADYSSEQTSLQHKRCLHWSSEQSLHPELSTSVGVEGLSASHVNLLRKMSLLKLTTLMDKYSPASKQGWNWTVPKVIRKSKATDHKERRVFGVPLLASVQRGGGPLPWSILKAMQYLRTQCLDQVGLFRKSGVKSRIQFLREMVEADPDGVSYEGQSAFDVADMVKQYFRDLPESIFSSKLCESFLHIYQYFPKDRQLAATQAAIFLLPDENREALQTLLLLLRDVVDWVEENQMTPTNIAVCLAPSLFHLNTLRRENPTSSKLSHRKYSLGRPDQRDLSENLAATQGLAHMISESPRLFQVPKCWMTQNQGMRDEDGVHLDWGLNFPAFSSEEDEDKRAQLDLSIQNALREARERFRSWTPCSTSDHVDVAFKKVKDGHALRLWKASAEVDALPAEVSQRLLRRRELWDRDLHSSRVVEALGTSAEVYHYVQYGVGRRPLQEHLLLRTWHHESTTGTFILAAVSTERPDVPIDAVRAEVFSCVHLLEPVGAKRTRLTHVCREDTRGRSPEWHNKVWGHRLSSEMTAIRDSFKDDSANTKT
nr:rho GTPase-activating protein 7-like isoform X2 [Paramormyrops kingsleyae]